MELLLAFGILLACYLIGSIPSGWVVVKITHGKDIRFIGSGRVGGTNVMRAAGFLAGAVTAIMDVIKGYSSYWILSALMPDRPWMQVAAAAITVLGQIYSIFLYEKNEQGKWRLRGGAGGATCLGGAMALFFPSLWIILPVAVLVFIFVGYASVTTISIALTALVIFSVRAVQGLGPWQHIAYGVLALLMVLWALRPNLKRLREGTERVVGLRAYFKKKRETADKA